MENEGKPDGRKRGEVMDGVEHKYQINVIAANDRYIEPLA